MTLTKVVFPEYWRPTNVSSISSFQNRDLNQSSSRLMSASIVLHAVVAVAVGVCVCISLQSNRKWLAALSCHVIVRRALRRACGEVREPRGCAHETGAEIKAEA